MPPQAAPPPPPSNEDPLASLWLTDRWRGGPLARQVVEYTGRRRDVRTPTADPFIFYRVHPPPDPHWTGPSFASRASLVYLLAHLTPSITSPTPTLAPAAGWCKARASPASEQPLFCLPLPTHLGSPGRNGPLRRPCARAAGGAGRRRRPERPGEQVLPHHAQAGLSLLRSAPDNTRRQGGSLHPLARQWRVSCPCPCLFEPPLGPSRWWCGRRHARVSRTGSSVLSSSEWHLLCRSALPARMRVSRKDVHMRARRLAAPPPDAHATTMCPPGAAPQAPPPCLESWC